MSSIDKDLGDRLKELLGPSGWVDPSEAAAYTRDWLDRSGNPPLLVVRPGQTADVAEIVKLCAAAGVSLVPQGGNTSLCGGSVAGGAGSVILSLERMSRIGPVSASTGWVEVEAGSVLCNLHAALSDQDLMFPLHLGAEGSAQIGGLISTNAGGSMAFRFGTMADLVLGLEVVLPDGRVWNGLRKVQKDNAGYQLRRVFAGAEGTLGIITRAVLRTWPKPRQTATALLAVPDVEALLRIGAHMRRDLGDLLSMLEFFSDAGVDMALRNIDGLQFPLDSRAPFYLLTEIAAGSDRIAVSDLLEGCLTYGFEEGLISDGVVAMSGTQREALWRLREEQPEGQRLEGPQLKHDISLPPDMIGEFLAQIEGQLEGILPGLRINPFGHLADGNIHFNLSSPKGKDFGSDAGALSKAIYGMVENMGGSFAAEHGLGRTKAALADTLRSPVERDLMRRIKESLDPGLVLNPDVITTQPAPDAVGKQEGKQA
ncbi:MAG: FAD-binding oxidoreductase [Hoeflea sp. D1-CHI-28]